MMDKKKYFHHKGQADAAKRHFKPPHGLTDDLFTWSRDGMDKLIEENNGAPGFFADALKRGYYVTGSADRAFLSTLSSCGELAVKVERCHFEQAVSSVARLLPRSCDRAK